MKKCIQLFLLFLLSFNLYNSEAKVEEKEKKVKWGLSERFRLVSWDNAIFLDDSRETANTFTRHRTSFWLDWKPFKKLRCYVKFTNEFRYYFQPDKDFTIHEIFPDNLYLQLNLSGFLPVTITAGRQNIILGEGFVIMDPNPLDGSRSIYFNGLRLDGSLAKGHTITMFYVKQPVIDDWLPIVNPQDQLMIEQPEEGMGLYYEGKGFNLNWEGYVILKNKLKTEDFNISSQIQTFGARFKMPVSNNVSLTTEGAFQKGDYGNNAISAWGGYSHLDYKVNEIIPCLQQFTLGAIALSGDDPGTSKMEGWDPLFSRWPKWSESYIYTLIPETGGKVAYWSNFSSLNGSFLFKFTRGVKLKLTYHYLRSFHDLAFISSRKYGRGKVRGDLWIVRSDFQLAKHLKGHIVFETFYPGNFYSSEDDPYNWFRFELMYSF